MTENHALAVTSNWLDYGTTTAAPNNISLCFGSVQWTPDYGWPWAYPVVSSPARPIKLALSEIERLRKAAKADPALKVILAKFTEQIEITVDFE